MGSYLKTTAYLVAILFFNATTPGLAVDYEIVPANEAIHYVGELATVCGTIVDTRYSVKSRGRPTYLNFEQPYPDNLFTAVVWGEHRKNFDYPPEKLKGKQVCVYGMVSLHKKKARMKLVLPKQVISR